MKKTSSLIQLDFLYQIASLYYDHGETQESIGQKVGLSRQKVQRLLEEARQEGVVEIRVINPRTSFGDLEQRLQDRFHLKHVRVVSGTIETAHMTQVNIGRAAARFLEERLTDGDILGIGWGRTIYQVLNFFHPLNRIHLTAVPLIGGIGQIASDFQVNELARGFAERAGGVFVPFHSPALVGSEKIAQTFFSDAQIQKVVQLWDRTNVALVGMGDSMARDALVPALYYDDPSILSLLKEGEAVGDIISHFIDVEGNLCQPQLSRRVIGISPDRLKKIDLVIGVAGSIGKQDIIHAALKGNFINVLITDENVARAILERSGSTGE